MYYGLTTKNQIWEHARAVCDVIGHGKNNVGIQFLQEIAAVETHGGMLRDRHATSLGTGLTQIDKETGFAEVMRRTKISTWESITHDLGIEINVSYEMLAYSPLLSILFTRLYLLPYPEFPALRVDRAEYWKKYFNSSAGAGTPEHYLRCCEEYL